MRNNRGRLARRLTLLFIIISILPILISSSLSVYSGFQFSYQEIATRQQSVISLGASYIESYIDNIFTKFKIIGELTSKEPAQVIRSLEAMCNSFPGFYSELVVTDSQGKELSHLIDCVASPSQNLLNRSNSELFVRTKRDEMFMGDVLFSKDNPFVQVSKFIKTQSGAEFVVMAVVNCRYLWKPVSSLKPGAGSYFYIVDRQGNLIGYQDIKSVGQKKSLASLPPVQSLLNQRQGIVAKRYRGLLGVEVIGTSTLVGKANWGVVVEQPVEQALAAPAQLLKNLVLLIGAVIFVAGVVAIGLARYIVRPINLLAQGAEAIAQGNLTYSLDISSKDEIGILARTFNQMTRQLRLSREELENYNRTLEQRVEQRTEELKKSQQRLSLLFQQTPLAVIEWDTNFEITDWNPAAEAIFGYSAIEAIGRHAAGLLVPESAREQVNQLFNDLLTQRGATRTITENFTKDGRTILCEWYSTSLIDNEGNAIGAASMALDITVRKQVEEELRKSKEYLRLIIDNIPQQVFWKDTNLVFQGCNKNWSNAAQIESPEAVVGLTDYDLTTNREIADFYRSQDRQIIERGTPELHVIQTKQKPSADGQTIWLDTNKIPIHDSKGNVIGILGVLEDITQRKQAEEALRLEKEKSELLLLNILPGPIAQRLKYESGSIADSFAEVTVLFADIVGFTKLSTRVSPIELVELLNQIFSTFDRLAEKHGLEKIKTIGDAYMVVGGLPTPRADHAEAIAEMALDMQYAIAQFNHETSESFSIRIGINTGPVVAGVIGIKKFIYDLWGDTVNTASRMESHGIPGYIQVTADTYERLQDKFVLDERGIIDVKGKGEMTTYFLTCKKPRIKAYLAAH